MENCNQPLKVLHCPSTVGGHSYGLASAERELGLNSWCMALEQNYLNYRADEFVFGKGRVLNELRRWDAIRRACTQFDVIHFNFGSSLAPMRVDASRITAVPGWVKQLYNTYAGMFEMLDVRLAARLGRIIAVTYQGDDARQGDYCKRHFPIHFAHHLEAGYYSDASDRMKVERIAAFDKYADLIYSVNPDLLHVLPERARFLPYANVDPREWLPVWRGDNLERELHVVHAPSHRKVKGTDYLLDAVVRLRSDGLNFRFTLVEGMSNAEAKRVYETADILVDQLLAGFYGGLAVELMALGKPVICYLRTEDFCFLPTEMVNELPIISSAPGSIYDVLKTCLTTRRHELIAIGEKGRKFVFDWHDPLTVAARLKDDYERVLSERFLAQQVK